MPSNRDRYLRFAEEAAGRSPAYVALAEAVADDQAILSFLGTLPYEKSQPNLLFGAACYLLGKPADIEQLRGLVGECPSELAREMVLRRTQTNEPARCATLLPALAQLPQPLALIEVGASAGLTLLFDKYSYDYDGQRVTGLDPDAPVLHSAAALPARFRGRTGCRRSSGGPAWTSTRSTLPTTTTCAGWPAWSGQVRAIGWTA
jgi:hypothetical protein